MSTIVDSFSQTYQRYLLANGKILINLSLFATIKNESNILYLIGVSDVMRKGSWAQIATQKTSLGSCVPRILIRHVLNEERTGFESVGPQSIYGLSPGS